MLSRSFHPVMIFITTMLMLFGLLSGCISDPVGSPPITTPNPVEEVDTAVSDTSPDVATQSVVISGHTMTVEGAPLIGTWVAIADTTTQELIAEATSDQSGAFTISFNGEVGDYTVLASYEDADVVLIAIQSFTVNDSDQDYQLDLSLSDSQTFDEDGDSGSCSEENGATPPPSCYYYVNGYYYQLCAVTHRFYAHFCYSCFPYQCYYKSVGSC